MLAPALWRHRCHRAFDQFEQRLLNAFARHIPRDAGVVRFARDLVDLIDVHDAVLRFVDFVIAVLQQLLNDVLDVLTDITGFGQRGRIRDDEGHIQQAGESLRKKRLAASSRPHQQNVALGQLNFVFLALVTKPLVVVVHRHSEDSLGRVLADHVLIEDRADF